MEGGAHRRLSLLEQMSAVDNGRSSLAGLTLDAVLSGGTTKPQGQEHQSNNNNNHHSRTLLDIIRDGEPQNSKDKKSWKNFREKLRLKRAGAAWTSSVPIPTSDISIPDNRSHLNRRGSVNRDEDSGPPPAVSRPQFTRRSSTRFGVTLSDHDGEADIGMPGEGPPSRSFRPQISRYNSTRLLGSNEDDDTPSAGRRLVDVLTEERVMSARDAVAAQEAAEAEAAAAAAAAAAATAAAAAAEQENEEDEVEPVRMSLMDLLEENDRELGLTGSRYTMGDDEDDEDDEEYYNDDDDDDGAEEEEEHGAGGMEYTCCVCMVRHKGAAFIPCGHTFCRLCSRELWVQRGNCPVCNGFILEILDIF